MSPVWVLRLPTTSATDDNAAGVSRPNARKSSASFARLAPLAPVEMRIFRSNPSMCWPAASAPAATAASGALIRVVMSFPTLSAVFAKSLLNWLSPFVALLIPSKNFPVRASRSILMESMVVMTFSRPPKD